MKLLVQKTVTVTMEMNEVEAQNLLDLLNSGVSTETLDSMNLRDIHSKLIEHFKGSNVKFESKAVKK